MKLAVIGNFEVHRYAHHWQGIKLGLDRMLWDDDPVIPYYLDMRHLGEGWNTGEGMSYKPEGIRRFHQLLKSFKPDAALLCTGDPFNTQTLRVLQGLDCFVVFWFCDLREPHPSAHNLMDHVDLVMMTAGGMVPKALQAWGLDDDRGVWMPQACLPYTGGTMWWEQGPVCDVIHIGSQGSPEWHADRRALFTHLTDHGVGLKLVDPVNDIEKAMVTARLSELYQKAKVCIGACHSDCAGYHSNRLMLTTGCGGFYFCNHFPWVEKLFEPGREIATYDPTQPLDIIQQMLEGWMRDEVKRKEVQKAGFERAQGCHTYPIRMAEVMAEIKKRI
tara:strand:+ start:7283 stop:8275 length:993 start_codon:yes stop_codon:yes gene_type:complete